MISSFGEWLKGKRLQLNLSQVAFAKKIGVGTSQIVNYENGKKFPSYETIKKLSRKLKVEVTYIVNLIEMSKK